MLPCIRCRGIFPGFVFQAKGDYGSKQYAYATEDEEGILPSEFLRHETSKEAAGYHPQIIGGLMYGHGPGTGASVMVGGNYPRIGRAEHPLAEPHPEAAEQDKRKDSSRKTGEKGSGAENQHAYPDLAATAQPVGIIPRERYRDGIKHIEQRGNQAHGAVRCAQVILNLWQYYVERLPVGLVQEEGYP